MAETLEDFAEALKIFLTKVHRPYERHRLVIKLQQIRDWKSFLDRIPKKVTGIAGQGAPHVLACVKRSSMLGSSLATPGAACDVILRCRQWMSDLHDSSIHAFLEENDLHKMRQRVPDKVLPMCHVTADFKKMITKYGNMLAQNPYNMGKASAALLDWIERKSPLEPLLDISYCNGCDGCLHNTNVPNGEVQGDRFGGGAVALEPPMNAMHIVQGRASEPTESTVTKKAQFVYPLAATLEKEHNLEWEQCLKLAEKCWGQVVERGPPPDVRAVPASDEGPVPLVHNVEPEIASDREDIVQVPDHS